MQMKTSRRPAASAAKQSALFALASAGQVSLLSESGNLLKALEACAGIEIEDQ